ncbi:hypothetical protein AB2M62_13950 [Sphingomonas sp. MMS12-HWE2-04]|uniref:hypothetical protein n=1 Tax=Sphingomonas sp. MMS12-HWE2-04 TaxID=3234199 RepID=UPI00384F229B
MTEHSEFPAFDPSSINLARYHGFECPPGGTRYDGWTPDRQRLFLEALSEGLPVNQASGIVGLSRQSAYALRHSPRGQAFALGWDAAVLLARNALVDALMERAFNGVREHATDSQGRTVTRFRHDNRLALAMLARLDRIADAEKPAASAAAARAIAGDFAQYLDLIDAEAGPARAGAFLDARTRPATAADLAPLRTLARADRWLRTHTDLAEPLALDDLDPAERAGWSGEQWARAEAAGLVALAPEPAASETLNSCQDCQPSEPVWWDEEREEWRTHFPPPEGFDYSEEGQYGEEGYERSLSADEAVVMEDAEEALREQRVAERLPAEAAARDAWFAEIDPQNWSTEALASEAQADADAQAGVQEQAAPDAG